MVIYDGLVHVVRHSLVLFYVKYCLIGLQYPECLQGYHNVLIGLFLRIALMSNISKSKTMTCHPGEIWSGMSEEAVGRKITGKVATYQERL